MMKLQAYRLLTRTLGLKKSQFTFRGVRIAGVVAVLFAAAIAAPAQTLTTLAIFTGSNGEYPEGSLIQASDGNFYGTTLQGGLNHKGTIFQVTSVGVMSVLYSFCSLSGCADGDSPAAALVQGTDGNFYGTTENGGTYDDGIVFKFSLTGGLTTLHSFNSADGAFPQSNLVQAPSGTFYGTARQGGITGSNGVVFKITPAGAFTALHSFDGSDGAYPSSGLVRGSDGNFYGTTDIGGTGTYCGVGTECGTVFKITPTGTLTTLHNFNGPDGTNPVSALVQGSGGFYGTTQSGGTLSCFHPYGCGTVFRITPAGTLSTIHKFHSTDGSFPAGALTLASDGNFYGTTGNGGSLNDGTIFEISSAGGFNLLFSFDGTNGSGVNPGLVQGTDGNFYGVSTFGGLIDSGTIFSLSTGLAPRVEK